MIKRFKVVFNRFAGEEHGVALSEYLVLIGILVGAVISAVLVFSETASNVFLTFANFVQSLAV